MLIGSSVCSVGSVVFPPRSLVRVGSVSFCWVFFQSSGIRLACEHPRAVVLVLPSAFLHVKISVKVVRIYLGMVTCFWSTFVLGGGGNVTFRGLYKFPAGFLYCYYQYVLRGHFRSGMFRLSW